MSYSHNQNVVTGNLYHSLTKASVFRLLRSNLGPRKSAHWSADLRQTNERVKMSHHNFFYALNSYNGHDECRGTCGKSEMYGRASSGAKAKKIKRSPSRAALHYFCSFLFAWKRKGAIIITVDSFHKWQSKTWKAWRVDQTWPRGRPRWQIHLL